MSPGPASDGGAVPARYTVDELASVTGVPSRTIRFYQSVGVLPRPARRGRVAVYDARHIERLRLVGRLQDRGLSLRAVRNLLRQDSEDARLLSSCFGLEKPWSDDRPQTVDHGELEELTADRPPETIASLVDFGVVERIRNGAVPAYRVASPGLLRLTLVLQASGVDVETAVHAGDILRRRLGTAARELVDYFSKRAGRGFGRSSAPAEIRAALDALRPLAGEAARLIFARQIERAIRDGSRPAASHRRRGKGRGWR